MGKSAAVPAAAKRRGGEVWAEAVEEENFDVMASQCGPEREQRGRRPVAQPVPVAGEGRADQQCERAGPNQRGAERLAKRRPRRAAVRGQRSSGGRGTISIHGVRRDGWWRCG